MIGRRNAMKWNGNFRLIAGQLPSLSRYKEETLNTYRKNPFVSSLQGQGYAQPMDSLIK
jgi:hypothetical protein